MLPRQLTLPPHTPAKLTPSPSHSCSLFARFPALPSFRINHLQPLFAKHPGGGYLSADLCCTEAQKCPSASPLFATLTHSVSRKSFACHSYANTRDGGVTPPPTFHFSVGNFNFVRPLFSYSYELLFPQPLSFHNHPHCPGVWGPLRTPCSDLGGLCVKSFLGRPNCRLRDGRRVICPL
jgi:hypothetical protein